MAMELRDERYEEPQVYELGQAVEFFLGDDGDVEDSAKVVACSQCSREIIAC
jgi:hypothetical protein